MASVFTPRLKVVGKCTLLLLRCTAWQKKLLVRTYTTVNTKHKKGKEKAREITHARSLLLKLFPISIYVNCNPWQTFLQSLYLH